MTTTNDDPVILSAADVAKLLGVDRKTVYYAARRGEIPHRRLGRCVLFERGTILAWLRQDPSVVLAKPNIAAPRGRPTRRR
ncbi:helix-turn-helix domain-containing protein [Nannocystaceae bacterium ST9]